MTNLPDNPPPNAGRQLAADVVDPLATPPLSLTPPPSPPWQPPVLGSLAAVFGIVALFKAALFLAPLGLAFAIAAGCRRQYGWALIGAVSAVVALAISPAFWTLFGLAWLLNWLV
ncbi:MAG: hypothetical protein ACREEE_04590 [Dongiaceae bacterium]